MTIGLVTTLNELTPKLGGKVAAVILSMVAIFETLGPFAAVKAFTMSGEVGKALETSFDDQPPIRHRKKTAFFKKGYKVY